MMWDSNLSFLGPAESALRLHQGSFRRASTRVFALVQMTLPQKGNEGEDFNRIIRLLSYSFLAA